MPTTPTLILASTSAYRCQLLERLRLPFGVVAADVDESPCAGEQPVDIARRLALAKAQAVAQLHPGSLVIGSDQVCDVEGTPLGKPGNHERAVAQLRAMQGRVALFHTAVAVVCAETGYVGQELATVRVRMRSLDDETIEAYLQAERPYDCAGSAKSEGLGIALLDCIESDDPTALVGLPLIRTCRLLRAAGVPVPG